MRYAAQQTGRTRQHLGRLFQPTQTYKFTLTGVRVDVPNNLASAPPSSLAQETKRINHFFFYNVTRAPHEASFVCEFVTSTQHLWQRGVARRYSERSMARRTHQPRISSCHMVRAISSSPHLIAEPLIRPTCRFSTHFCVPWWCGT